MKLITPHTLVSLLVKDQDEALHFYTQMLGLEKRNDIVFGQGLRLLTVALPEQTKPEIALARPDALWHGEVYMQQTVAKMEHAHPLVLQSDHCYQDYELLRMRGVPFVHPPTEQAYGVEALFADPSGNTFILLEISALLHRDHTTHAA